MKYQFNKARHLHQLQVDGEWKNLTGCTTILSVVAKPALISWSANMTAKYIEENAPLYSSEPKIWKVDEVLLELARKAHAKRKTEAGSYGTKTHETITEIINDCIKNSAGFIRSGKNPEPSIQNFLNWAIENKVKFLETERNIYSEELFIGGIVDIVCEIDGQLWIGDIKTSGSGIYPEHIFQTAGYGIMLKDMKLYENFAGYLILNLKENGEMLEKRSISIKESEEAFLACLKIYRVLEKLKSQIK